MQQRTVPSQVGHVHLLHGVFHIAFLSSRVNQALCGINGHLGVVRNARNSIFHLHCANSSLTVDGLDLFPLFMLHWIAEGISTRSGENACQGAICVIHCEGVVVQKGNGFLLLE